MTLLCTCGWFFCHLVCLSRYDYHNRVELDIRWIQKLSQLIHIFFRVFGYYSLLVIITSFTTVSLVALEILSVIILPLMNS